jgi:4-hydroxy 2-oxovalerate aldolase
MIPMREEIEWGYIIPYMVTGILNEHPRTAIAYRQTSQKDKYAEFYEQMRDAHD